MFLLPLVLLVGAGFAIYALVRHRTHAVGVGTNGAAAGTGHASFWPTSTTGKLGVGALAAAVAGSAFTNLVQVPFLGWGLVAAAVVLTGLARLRERDRSPAVLVALAVSAIGLTAAVLFIAGEVFIGHD